MGKLVHFEGRRKGPPGNKPEGAESGQILIFTGVRYERESSNAPSKPPASSGAKRKRG